tara:strand:+ start:2438 stop:2779 length:342 start_codon:yes stop_codon:yes gene_type:complete
MSLTASIILESLANQSTNVWFSRKNDNDSYDNIQIKEVNAGDIAWFSARATSENVVDTRKALAQMNLHLYSKELAESSKKGKPYMRKTESGAFSFLILPNEGTLVSNDDDAPF